MKIAARLTHQYATTIQLESQPTPCHGCQSLCSSTRKPRRLLLPWQGSPPAQSVDLQLEDHHLLWMATLGYGLPLLLFLLGLVGFSWLFDSPWVIFISTVLSSWLICRWLAYRYQHRTNLTQVTVQESSVSPSDHV